MVSWCVLSQRSFALSQPLWPWAALAACACVTACAVEAAPARVALAKADDVPPPAVDAQPAAVTRLVFSNVRVASRRFIETLAACHQAGLNVDVFPMLLPEAPTYEATRDHPLIDDDWQVRENKVASACVTEDPWCQDLRLADVADSGGFWPEMSSEDHLASLLRQALSSYRRRYNPYPEAEWPTARSVDDRNAVGSLRLLSSPASRSDWLESELEGYESNAYGGEVPVLLNTGFVFALRRDAEGVPYLGFLAAQMMMTALWHRRPVFFLDFGAPRILRTPELRFKRLSFLVESFPGPDVVKADFADSGYGCHLMRELGSDAEEGVPHYADTAEGRGFPFLRYLDPFPEAIKSEAVRPDPEVRALPLWLHGSFRTEWMDAPRDPETGLHDDQLWGCWLPSGKSGGSPVVTKRPAPALSAF